MTFMTDPLDRYQNGGDEVEMETVLGWLRTKDDLRPKMQKSSTRELVSEDEVEERADTAGAAAAEKKKKPKGKGKGKDEDA